MYINYLRSMFAYLITVSDNKDTYETIRFRIYDYLFTFNLFGVLRVQKCHYETIFTFLPNFFTSIIVWTIKPSNRNGPRRACANG